MIKHFIFFAKKPFIYALLFFFHPPINPAWYSSAQISQLNRFYTLPAVREITGHRFATLNSRGYVFHTINPLSQRFIDEEAVPHKLIMEIGAGFSRVAGAALGHGSGFYVANDMSLDHLKLLVNDITHYPEGNSLLSRLMLLHAQAPYDLPPFSDYFDAILLDKVLHFMNPDEIEHLLAWFSAALKPQGRVYILTISPYAATFKNDFLPIYQIKKEIGDSCPGYVENIFDYFNQEKAADHPDYQLSYTLTFFCKAELEALFRSHGFEIIESYYTTLPDTNDGSWRIVEETESGLVALIAQKL